MRPLSTTGLLIVVAIIAYMLVTSLPGILRYIRISNM
jgi:Tfp pilus assembly protein FimT